VRVLRDYVSHAGTPEVWFAYFAGVATQRREYTRNPFRILLVGLATRHILSVLRIRQNYRELSFHNIPHWFSVTPAAFHRYWSHTELL
jgi:hypothetical protein